MINTIISGVLFGGLLIVAAGVLGTALRRQRHDRHRRDRHGRGCDAAGWSCFGGDGGTLDGGGDCGTLDGGGDCGGDGGGGGGGAD